MFTTIRWNGERFTVKLTDENGDLICLANFDYLSDARRLAFHEWNHGHVVDFTVR